MPSTPTSSRDVPAPALPGDFSYPPTPAGPGPAAASAVAGAVPPPPSMAGPFPPAPASYGTYPYPASGPVYYPVYGQGLPSAPPPPSSMGSGYASPLGVPMVGMRPSGYAPYMDDRRPLPSAAPRHDRAYTRPYAPRHATRPGAGAGTPSGPGPGPVLGADEALPHASSSPALARRGRDDPVPEFVPSGPGQLTPRMSRLQAQAPRFTPSPGGVRSEGSGRDGPVPEASPSTYVHSRLPALAPLPPAPDALQAEELHQLPEGVKEYITRLESLVAAYKAREEDHQLQLEALAFNPVLALRGPGGNTPATQDAVDEAGTGPEPKNEPGLDQISDPELDPAPILGIRLLHRVQELTEENEELGRLLEKRVCFATGADAPPEEAKALRDDLEDAHTLLEHLDAAVNAANERTRQMEEALQSVCSTNSVGIADSLASLRLYDPSSSSPSTANVNVNVNMNANANPNAGANPTRDASSSPRPRRDDRAPRPAGRRPAGPGQGQKASRGTPRSGTPRSGTPRSSGARTGSEGKPGKGQTANK